MAKYKKPNNNYIPPKQSKKKKWTASHVVVLILMIIWTVGTALSVVLTAKDCKEASADTVSFDFTSGNIFTPYSNIDLTNHPGYTWDLCLKVSFSDSGTNTWVDLSQLVVIYSSAFDSEASLGLSTFASFNRVRDRNTGLTFDSSRVPVNFTSPASLNFFLNTVTEHPPYHSPILSISLSSNDFNANITQIRYLSYQESTYVYYNCVDFIDNNGHYIRFGVVVNAYNDRNFLLFTERVYHLGTNLDGYQIGYDNGYLAGKDTGYNNGYEVGNRVGYDNGYSAGKSVGFNEGVSSANDYSFLGLIGAVVDAPITALSGLLNFDLLGFNMANFFFALCTLALIIFVVRLVL